MPRFYIRTCQSCGYELKQPTEPKDKSKSSFVYRKCPKCKSESFDYGSWRGMDAEQLQAYRDRFETLTGKGLVMTDNELEEILLTDIAQEGLFEGNELFNELVKRSKANAEGIVSATISYQGY